MLFMCYFIQQLLRTSSKWHQISTHFHYFSQCILTPPIFSRCIIVHYCGVLLLNGFAEGDKISASHALKSQLWSEFLTYHAHKKNRWSFNCNCHFDLFYHTLWTPLQKAIVTFPGIQYDDMFWAPTCCRILEQAYFFYLYGLKSCQNSDARHNQMQCLL